MRYQKMRLIKEAHFFGAFHIPCERVKELFVDNRTHPKDEHEVLSYRKLFAGQSFFCE